MDLNFIRTEGLKGGRTEIEKAERRRLQRLVSAFQFFSPSAFGFKPLAA
jgi:hypothetical protein